MDIPTTNFTTGQTSINACIAVPPIKCKPGEEYINDGITTRKKCKKCTGERQYSKGGEDITCRKCPEEFLLKVSDKLHIDCIDRAELTNADAIKTIFQRLDEQKEKTNDLSIKNSRFMVLPCGGLQASNFLSRLSLQHIFGQNDFASLSID